MAAYNRSLFAITPDQFRERANRVVRHDSVPLAVLDYQFNWLDTLAVQDGLVSLQNGVLYNVSAPSRSPYLVRNLTLAAPLIDTLRQYTATFVLPPALLLTNRNRRVSGVLVDFNDGGPNRSLLPGQSLTITYPSNGRKVVWFAVQYSDGTTERVRSAIYVKAPTVNYRSEPIALVNLATVEARIPFQDYNSTATLFGVGDVLGVLHNPASLSELDNHQTIKLRRPVIIMDGFDPKDERPLFRINNEKSFYNDLKAERILELLDDQNLQRDLIILNFPVGSRRTTTGTTTPGDIDGGADYIERNAMVLVELINRLKPMLDIDPATGQPYQFTIIGPSMGGLISRYALAYMEKQAAAGATPPTGQTAAYWQHNTATWVSFDAPHQGAVVPIADQAFLGFFQGVAASARETFITTINSPAAKQMLVHHVSAPGNTPAGAPGFRDRFMLALRDNGEPGSLGYPVHLRRVAIADGQLNGQGIFGGSPCGSMFDVEMKLRTGYAIAATVLSVLFSPLGSQAPTRVGACTARYAPGPGSSCTVFEGMLNYGIFGFNYPGGFTYVPIYGRRVIDSGSQGSYDLAPGGLRDTQASLKRQAEGAGHGEKYKVNVTNVHENHCFIPTVSALGFQYQSTASYQNTGSLPNPYTNLLNRGDLVCNNEIPFDAFYAPATNNLGHVTTDAGAIAFLVRELTPRVATPIFAEAPTGICLGGTAYFSVSTCATRAGQPATTYNWTPGAGLVIISGQGTDRVLVQATAGFAGNTTLEVMAIRGGATSPNNITGLFVSDGYLVLTNDPAYGRAAPGTKTVPATQAAKPVPSPNYTCSQTIHLLAEGFSAPPPYTVTVTTYRNTGPTTKSFSTATSAFQVTVNDFAISVVLSGSSSCNGGTVTSNVYQIPGCAGRPVKQEPAAYPNPADAVLNLAAPEAAEAGTPHTAVLYNTQGREVRRTHKGEVQLPTADLPTGLYYLITEQNGQVSRSQIRVQH